eukprot:gene34335-biopygen9209
MIWAEADKLGWFINTVTDQVLAKEKQVVKNEKRQSVDNNPYGHTSYVIDKALYPADHPYNWQVIGSLEDLQNATVDDVKEFFRRWYVPNNVSLVIADEVATAVSQAFAKFEKEGISDKDLNRIKAGQETQFYNSLSSVLGKSAQLAEYNYLTGNPGFVEQDIKNILAVTPADVMRVYEKYIKGKNYVATSFVPKGKVNLALSGSSKAEVVEEKSVQGAEAAVDPNINASYTKTPSKIKRDQEPAYGAAAEVKVPKIGYPALAATDKDYYPANVMNYILGGGGFASRLTQELREGKGYTYGIRSGFSGTKSIGDFSISSGVRTNVTLESTQLIKKILQDFTVTYSDADLETTKSFLIKSNARAFETASAKLGMLDNISKYGWTANYVKEREQIVKTMTVDQIKALSQKYLDPIKMIWLVVGDAKTQLS